MTAFDVGTKGSDRAMWPRPKAGLLLYVYVRICKYATWECATWVRCSESLAAARPVKHSRSWLRFKFTPNKRSHRWIWVQVQKWLLVLKHWFWRILKASCEECRLPSLRQDLGAANNLAGIAWVLVRVILVWFGSAKSLRLSNVPEEIQHCLILFNGCGSDRANYISPAKRNPSVGMRRVCPTTGHGSHSLASCHNGKLTHRIALL